MTFSFVQLFLFLFHFYSGDYGTYSSRFLNVGLERSEWVGSRQYMMFS